MAKGKRTRHSDGSLCPEGTQRVPKKFEPCCADFKDRTLACYYDIRYEWWPQHRSWFTIIPPDAGNGGIAINFCPHCGSKVQARRKAGRYIEV